MSNNLFAVGKSGNPNGRPKGTKYSVLTTKGRIDRFLAKNMTPRAMQKLYNGLSAKDQSAFLTELLPYCLPKQGANTLTAAEVDKIYEEVTKAIQEGKPLSNGKATG